MADPPKGRGMSVRVRAGAGKSVASRRWLERQLNDPYVAAAKARGFRSRAAFKLLELDEKCGLLKPGLRVVDLGAAPGGWTQVAVKAVGPKGQVVALDILPMDPVPGATVLQADFTEAPAEEAVRAALHGMARLSSTRWVNSSAMAAGTAAANAIATRAPRLRCGSSRVTAAFGSPHGSGPPARPASRWRP